MDNRDKCPDSVSYFGLYEVLIHRSANLYTEEEFQYYLNLIKDLREAQD